MNFWVVECVAEGEKEKRRDVKDIHIARLSLLSSALADLGRETGLDGGD